MTPCTWPIERSCLPTPNTDAERIKHRHAENLAVGVLWALSGRQFGSCPVTVRPCPTPCTDSWNGALLGNRTTFPIYESGGWRTTGCGCGARCVQAGPGVIHLKGPVTGVTEVSIDGIVLEPEAYRLEGEYLYRLDEKAWPSQDLQSPLGETGTWSVTYNLGHGVPPGVDMLTGILTAEFIGACSPGGKCRLPRRVQSMSRNGVSYQMVDPQDIYRSGKTGIPEIDLWLASVNPKAIMSAPKVR